MAHSGQNRRKHAPARHSSRTLEQLEARLLLSVNTLVKNTVPAIPKIIIMPATTVSGSQSILRSPNLSGSTASVSVVSSAGDSIPSHASITKLFSGLDSETSSDSASRVSLGFGMTDIADSHAAAEESIAMESLSSQFHLPSEYSPEASVTLLTPELLDLAIPDLDLYALQGLTFAEENVEPFTASKWLWGNSENGCRQNEIKS